MPGPAMPPRAKEPWQRTPNANNNGWQSRTLGAWKETAFKFNSPEAEAEWVRNAYRSGVHEKNWHLGKVVDDKSRDMILAGIGGPQRGIYPAPDGTYRTIDPKTIEDQAARDHRAQHVRGKTIDQIASMTQMPGEDEWVENWKARYLPVSAPKVISSAAQAASLAAANDNQGKTALRVAGMAPRIAPPAPVNDRQEQAADQKSPGEMPGFVKTAPQKTLPPVQRAAAGRSGVMPPALAAAERQAANDTGRILLQSVTGDYGDHLRAGASAIGDMFEGKSFTESFNQHLPEEEQKTAAARERQGLAGTATEMAVGAIPVIGDLSGAVADFKDWKENGDDWGWEDYGLVALGLVPGMVNRKTVKGAVKIAGELIGDGRKAAKAGDEIAALTKKDAKLGKAEAGTYDHRAGLEKAQTRVYTEKEARNLGGENRGLIYTQEKMQGSERSMRHQSGGRGAFSDIASRKFANPALRFDNPNPRGRSHIRFDNAYSAADNSHTMLVDSKTKLAIWGKATQTKTIKTLERVKHAVMQNPGYKVQYEFDTDEAAEETWKFIEKHNYSNYVSVGVRKS